MSSAETIDAFNSGLDTGNLHRPTTAPCAATAPFAAAIAASSEAGELSAAAGAAAAAAAAAGAALAEGPSMPLSNVVTWKESQAHITQARHVSRRHLPL